MKHGVLFLLALITFIRVLVYYQAVPAYPDGTKLKLSFQVLTEPKYYDDVQLLRGEGHFFYLPRYPEISYGDTVVVTGVVTGPKIENAELIKHEVSRNPLFTFRRKLMDFYRSNLPTKNAALVSGMVLGSGELLSRDFWDNLISTGTAHVVVASGMNVTLVAGFVLFALCGFVSRKWATLISVTFVWCYVIVAGFGGPVVRAGVMGTLFLISQYFGRQAHTIRLLIFTGLIMLLVRPQWTGDLGFILSFAATLSLILFASKVDIKLHFVPKVVRGDLSTTIAAQVFVAPILFLAFGRFNFLSPIPNMLVLWSVPLITIIGMLAGIASLIVLPLGKLILLLVYPLTSYFVFIVGLISKLPLF